MSPILSQTNEIYPSKMLREKRESKSRARIWAKSASQDARLPDFDFPCWLRPLDTKGSVTEKVLKSQGCKNKYHLSHDRPPNACQGPLRQALVQPCQGLAAVPLTFSWALILVLGTLPIKRIHDNNENWSFLPQKLLKKLFSNCPSFWPFFCLHQHLKLHLPVLLEQPNW